MITFSCTNIWTNRTRWSLCQHRISPFLSFHSPLAFRTSSCCYSSGLPTVPLLQHWDNSLQLPIHSSDAATVAATSIAEVGVAFLEMRAPCFVCPGFFAPPFRLYPLPMSGVYRKALYQSVVLTVPARPFGDGGRALFLEKSLPIGLLVCNSADLCVMPTFPIDG